jgi:hypothetical protein
MEYRMSALVGRGLALSLTLFTTSAFAQNNPEQGDVRYQTTVQTGPGATTTTTTSNGPFVTQVATTGTDHALVVGHLGVGHFGIVSIPYLSAAMGEDPAVGSLNAPTIGARYWLDERLAIEGAIGIGFESGGTTTKNGNVSTEVSDPSIFGLALHAGLPLVFATSSHFAFELIPELNFGFASGGTELAGPMAGDVNLSGVMLQLGARVGAEIQFGFIDIPQLALQATVGLHMTYTGVSASNDMANVSVTRSDFTFGTTLQNTPWDIFRTSVAAIYYF